MRLRVEPSLVELLEERFDQLVAAWLDQRPPSPFVRNGKGLDSLWNQARWAFACACRENRVSVGDVADKVLRLLRLKPDEAPDALAFIFTSMAGQEIIDDLQFFVEHLLHTRPFLWDGEAYTGLLLSFWERTKAWLTAAGEGLPADEVEEADRAAKAAQNFFGTLKGPPLTRRSRVLLMAATWLNQKLPPNLPPEQRLDSMLGFVRIVRDEYTTMTDEERKAFGSFDQYFLDIVADDMGRHP